MANLLIAVGNIATGQGNTNRSVDESLLKMKKWVERVAGWATDPGLEAGNKFNAIFVAPEYFFIDKHATDRLPLSADDAAKIEVALLKLSKDHPKIVLAPGSIFYQEKMTEEKVKEAKSNALAAEFAARLRANPGALGTQVKPSALFSSRGPQDKGLNVVGVRNIPGAAERNKEMDRLELGEGADGYWGTKKGLINIVTGLKSTSVRARNRAYLLLNGEKMGMYDKHSDFFETGKGPDRFFFIPGTNEQCPVIGGFKFGMEICADHRLGVLENRHVSALDFQIVLSDMIEPHYSNVCVQTGGYYIHASSSAASTEVVGNTATGLVRYLSTPAPQNWREGTVRGIGVPIARRG